jgi:hypothetical protein
MDDFLFSARLPDGREVCIAPISSDVFEDNEADSLGDDSGYFIFEYDADRPSSGIEILGKAASYDAALRLIEIFLAAQRGGVISHAGVGSGAPRRLPPEPRPAGF